MSIKSKKKGFFSWLFEKWYYWVISIAWGVLSGFEKLQSHYFSEFLGILLTAFLIVMFGFWITYIIKKSISKQVKKELENNLKKKK